MSQSVNAVEVKDPSMAPRITAFAVGGIIGAVAGYFAADFLLNDSTSQAWVAVFWAMLGGLILLSFVSEDTYDAELEEEWATHWRGMP